MNRPLLLWIAVLALAAPATGADSNPGRDHSWPHWRGPRADGVAPHADPPLRWSETENVRWKVALPGKGNSTPIVWGDQIFLTTAVETGKPAPGVEAAEANPAAPGRPSGVAPEQVLQFVVLAVDRRDGRIRWRRTVREAAPHEGTHVDGSWASASPVTDGKRLVAHFGSAGTYGLDLDGNVRWEVDLGDMTTRNAFGEGSSPVLTGNTVVVNWDHEGSSFLAALDAGTGKVRWKVSRDEPTSWSTPLVVDVADKAQVVVAATRRTRSYDLATGRLVWEAAGMTANAIPSPVAAAGRVYVMSGFRGNALQAIDLSSAQGDISGKAAIVWRFDQDTPYVPSPLLSGDRLYFLKHNTGVLSCFDARAGKPHYSRQRLEGIEGVYASPVAAAGRVYVTGRNGATAVLRDGSAFELLATNRLEDGFEASAAVAGDEIYLRGRKHLYCVAQKSHDAGSEPSLTGAAERE